MKEDPMAMVTDPVCGMRIDDGEAAGTAEYEGTTYYFCSEVCRETFVADPGTYAGARR
jgi:YHS domain-containing protein